jgi:hypothetical protein
MAQAEYVTSAIRALITGASAKLSTSPVRAAHAEFVASLAGHPPRPIPVDAILILDDTAQNAPGGLDLRHIEAILSDLASDVAGIIQHAADSVAGRVA